MTKAKIIFIGMPEMAPICLNALYEAKKDIAGIIMPPKNSGALYKTMQNMANSFKIPAIDYEKDLDEQEFIEKVKNLKADIGIVASYSKKFPKALLESTKLGFVNAHPSLLPNYRGGNPYFHPINNNEKMTGVTLHFMDEGFDTGNIIFQQSLPILPFETMGTLFNRTSYILASNYINLINHLEKTGELPSYPQDTKGNYIKAPMVYEHKGHNRINWNTKAESIERFIRACNPFLMAITTYRNNFCKIHTGFFDPDKTSKEQPGTISEVGEHHIGIATAQGTFYPRSIQVGSYFAGDIKLFIQYIQPKIGEIFI